MKITFNNYFLTLLIVVFFSSCQYLVYDREKAFTKLDNEKQSEIINELKDMVEKDQELRFNFDDLDITAVNYNKKKDSISKIINRENHKNTKRLIEIIKKYGYLNNQKIDSIPISLILLHSPTEYNLELKKLLEIEVNSGRIPRLEYKLIQWHLDGRKENFSSIYNESGVIKASKFEIYDYYARRAMIYFKDSNYEAALINFKQSFLIIPNKNSSDYFYAVASALHLEKQKEAENLLKEAIINCNASKQFFLNFVEFEKFRNLPLFESIELNYENYKSKFYKNLANKNVYIEIDSLLKIDQEVRKKPIDIVLMNKVDSLNIVRLIELTKENGWQEKAYDILWHHRNTFRDDNYVWNFFRPFINKQINKGLIDKSFWSSYEDFESIQNNKIQIYGSYFSQFNIYPIKNIKNIDSLRREVNLPPLWYMKKIYGIKLPENYISTDSLKLKFDF